MSVPHLFLASSSPRRGELLAQIGVPFTRVAAEVDERVLAGETPEMYALRLALAKARAGRALLADAPQLPVLGADTCVVVDGEILGKPADRNAGLAMLGRLSGREHRVMSAVAVADGLREASRLSLSHVIFRPLGEAERAAYWASGEPADKAGGYAIQGLGALFVERLEGSYSGVMGLPLFETAELLRELGFDLLERA